MKCPFCAEEIQDAAILCRHCGAMKSGDTWCPPARMAGPPPPPATPVVRPKGSFTIKTAGVFFLASGAVSLAGLTTEVPLGGAMRGGPVAIGYNLLYAAMFVGMGVGLLTARSWGYHLVLAGTFIYTVDKAVFLLNKSTRDAYLTAQGMTREAAELLGADFFDHTLILINLAMLAGWWGFVVYLYFRRAYFDGRNRSVPPPLAGPDLR